MRDPVMEGRAMLARTVIWLYGVFWVIGILADPATSIPLLP